MKGPFEPHLQPGVNRDQPERDEFPGHRVWRSMRGDVPGEWCATLHDPKAGVDSTLMEPTAADLRERLLAERERAKARLAVPAPQ